ncbi:precorrin-3B C(17)-methyltransferase [Oceanibium sediminis]|uniref:precorrin-3B C(17)-methyltransferase n=1 Tax=Oceanibium sediminis TaxID=2026339 RepID=UPI000DD46E7A|nr:precorrin-3B C(17)-methyltransferase [Oceanibium sediminis]
MQAAEPVVLSLTAGAMPLAERLAEALGAQHHPRLGPDGFGDVAAHVQGLFQAGTPIIGICASGILIRTLAPVLGDKWAEPPVLAVAEDGSAVVPLLGGHRGANALARQVAEVLDSAAAITTAGDLRLGVALDEPPQGWTLDNPEDAKAAMAALLSGAAARISGTADWLAPLDAERVAGDGPVVLSVEGAAPLIYRQRRFALGVGCARGTAPEAMISHVGAVLADNGIAGGELAEVVSIDVKADEAAVHALAAHYGVPARFFPADVLEAETPRLSAPSDIVFAEVGCHGVAEGAALAAAGPDGALVVEKVKSPMATCALARIGTAPRKGMPRGHLAVVGIGPGAAEWRTPEATRLIREADELVGYGLYLDLLGPLAKGKPRREFALGEEELRCRYALESAGEGRRVALISSGDAGIFAMGALVAELLDRDEDTGGVSAAARRVAVQNAPGISALQAASARAGALLGHDFCAISLSDLLTPRETIIQRLHAAAAGDFVIAFYNPVSRRRRTLLAEARDILLEQRPADTPVLLASNLGRPEEQLRRRTLATLEVDEVDMLTVVLIGASQTRAFQTGDIAAAAEGWQIYTPRGYAKKLADVE